MSMRRSGCYRRRRQFLGSALAVMLSAVPVQPAPGRPAESGTSTPIRHLIVIVGENHTFDNVFATYQPRQGQSVWNLLSEGIVDAQGNPGVSFNRAAQNQAMDTTTYSIAPNQTGPYSTLPQPNTTYAFGQSLNLPDARFPADLPNGPFQLTKYVPYQLSFTGDPVHRFFQMWQQVDEGRMDLFAWVAETVGTGPQNFPPAPTPSDTFQGGVAMGFFNMASGDAPVFKYVADHYAISDNYHQGIMGGTGANFIYLGTADVGYFSDGNGHPLTPPSNQIENPNPQSGTNNFYTQDGYAGGSYVNCSDPNQPGVAPILSYLNSLGVSGNCAPGAFYLVNNYSPGFNPDGTPKPLGSGNFTLPPQTLPSIADALSAQGVSWKYYIGGWNNGHPNAAWCSICNPFEFISSVMTNPSMRANIRDVPDFYNDLAQDNLPAVAFIRPYEGYAGHPADSSLSAYEDFVAAIANAVISQRALFTHTAILVTTDEGGGYYDSGYIQPLDFFGDGTRIPLLVISPWVTAGKVDHTYYDHGSILKFIERNWGLHPLSGRSRDNLPNPMTSATNAYVPVNGPAIGDLMNLFSFEGRRHTADAPLIIPSGR
jgi:acid phosphatase